MGATQTLKDVNFSIIQYSFQGKHNYLINRELLQALSGLIIPAVRSWQVCPFTLMTTTVNVCPKGFIGYSEDQVGI